MLLTTFIIIATLIIIFVSLLYFITKYDTHGNHIKIFDQDKVVSNNLLQKPRKRWRYIKELENHQPVILI